MRDKDSIREEIWTALEQAKVARAKSVHDKIPHFKAPRRRRTWSPALKSGSGPGWSRATRTKPNAPCASAP